MMLNLFKHIEEDVHAQRHVPPRVGRCSVSACAPSPRESAFMRGTGRVKLTFRLVAMAEVTTDDTKEGRDHARQNAAQILAHQMFADMRMELEDALRWAMETGAGYDVEEKIYRLIELASGRDVPGQQQEQQK